MTTTRSKRRWIIAAGILVPVLAALLIVRLYLGVWVLNYVNHVLSTIPGYEGSVASINIDIYRGAYQINRLKLFKKDGNIPTPFINIEQADISLQWSALLHGRVVSSIFLERPVLNFAVDKSGTSKQTGAETDWTAPVRKLAPIDINRVVFEHGKLTYQDFSANPKVNVYINNMSGEVRNLRNVSSVQQPLPSTISLAGTSIGDGKLGIKGRLNILKQIPDMDLEMKLENVNLTALNDYSNAYAAIDIKKGDLSIYSELIIKDDTVTGYVKPLATNISLMDLHKDANPIKVAWESVASVLLELFTNHHQDQFATNIQLQGRFDKINTNVWSTLGGIFHNAFVSAYQKGFNPLPQSVLTKSPAPANP